MIQSFSWNQTSHYDLIRSLNDDRTTIDRLPGEHRRQGLLQGPLLLRARARAGAVRAALLRRAEPRRRRIVDATRTWRRRDHPGDEMIYLIGLWGNVLPGLLLLLLVWRVAERFEPGYGVAAAVALGLGTMVLPLSTLLFSHVFTTFLGFAAFWLMLRERDGPPSAMLLALAGLAMGYAFSSEYPMFFVALVLGLFLLSRRDSLHAAAACCAAAAPTSLGGLVGHRPAAALQPLRLPLLDAPRLLRRAAPAERLLRDRRAQPEGARDAAVRLARPADDLAGADHGRDRHGAALQARQARRGADDRRRSASATWATTRATTCPSAAASWARAS